MRSDDIPTFSALVAGRFLVAALMDIDAVSNNADIKAIIAPGTLILLSFIGSE